MKSIKIKETYLLFLIVIGLVSLATYSTYALFTTSTEIINVVGFETTLTTDSNILEYEMVTVPAGETKIVELNVNNSYEASLYYGAWYEIVSAADSSRISIGLYTDENDTPSSGQIVANTSLTLLVGIINANSSDVIINIGTVGSLTENLGLDSTKKLLYSGWTPEGFFDIKIVMNTEGIPTTGLYTMSSTDCSNVTYDPVSRKVKVADYTGKQTCSLQFTSSADISLYPLLNTMKVGDYVAYVGNSGCLNGETGTTGTGAAESGNSCKGENANQPAGTIDEGGAYGYCHNTTARYFVYGWRIAYIEEGKVHLVSAGSPECRERSTSTDVETLITDLNTVALKYCNSEYVDGGQCATKLSSSNVWAMGNTDFEKITNAFFGTSYSLTTVYDSRNYCNGRKYLTCGYGNDLIDNGGYYWFAAHYSNSTWGVSWSPGNRYVNGNSATNAYGFRPIIALSSSVYVTGGSGTMLDPYIIGN